MIKVPLWIRDLLKQDGSRTLTSDWDIGNGRMIQADKIRARDGDGLALYEDGGAGIFVKDGGSVGIGTTSPLSILQIYKDLPAPDDLGDFDNYQLVIRGHSDTGDTAGILLSTSQNTYGGSAIVHYDTGGWGIGDLVFYTKQSVAAEPPVEVMRLDDAGNVGIGTSAPANPLAINRAADGIIVDFESADTVEGNVSIAGTTTSYNAFMGSHYTQLKDGQTIPPIGAIVIATGEIIHCEANIKVPVKERYYEEEVEATLTDSIEDDVIEEQVDTGEKQTAYVLINGEVIETEIPVLETVTRVKGKKLKGSYRLDETTGKIYIKTDKILEGDAEAPVDVTVLERQKTKDGNPLTEIKTKEVGGIERKEYFSYVELASQKADKRVYGVYHAKLSDDAKGQSFGEDDKAIHQIAALGLYKVRVTDTNGDIEGGDYIQSSIRAGEGEKQDDDVLHNYTVAKSIINVNWNEVTVDLELGYKWQLIPATLHSG